MFHGHSNSKCKVLIERKYIQVCFKVLFINKFKVAYMCASGPWKHTRALGAVLEVEIQKEKIYSRVEAHRGKFSKNIYIYPCKTFWLMTLKFPKFNLFAYIAVIFVYK